MKGKSEINGYELSRDWFDWCYENPDKISPIHSALYFFIIEHCNRLGWKEKFGLPSQMTMDALGIKNWRTFKRAFDDMVLWGFVKLIEKSKNQYSANVIAIVKNTKAHTKALAKATQKHVQKHSSSIAYIDKPYNKGTIEPENILSDENPTSKTKCEFWKSFIEKFEKFYELKKGSPYSYLAKDFKSLKSVHWFLKTRAAKKNTEFTEENLLAAFDYFLNKAWDKDEWLRNNFSIPNLLAQFNQISNSNGQQSTNHTKQPTGSSVSMQSIAQRLANMPDG